jgi:hypothetical protein
MDQLIIIGEILKKELTNFTPGFSDSLTDYFIKYLTSEAGKVTTKELEKLAVFS